MSYQGARGGPAPDEAKHVFAISKVRLGGSGQVTDVLWCEINAKSNLDMASPVVVTVAEVIDALHDGAQVSAIFPKALGSRPDHAFEVVEHRNGVETIDLIVSSADGGQRRARLTDLARIDD